MTLYKMLGRITEEMSKAKVYPPATGFLHNTLAVRGGQHFPFWEPDEIRERLRYWRERVCIETPSTT